jgi:hypothetical protein
LHKLALDCL